MTHEELTKLVNGLNDHMRLYVAFDDAESNNQIEKGWFTEDDITNFCGVECEDDTDKITSAYIDGQDYVIDRAMQYADLFNKEFRCQQICIGKEQLKRFLSGGDYYDE